MVLHAHLVALKAVPVKILKNVPQTSHLNCVTGLRVFLWAW
jgi:hypothetical protein